MSVVPILEPIVETRRHLCVCSATLRRARDFLLFSCYPTSGDIGALTPLPEVPDLALCSKLGSAHVSHFPVLLKSIVAGSLELREPHGLWSATEPAAPATVLRIQAQSTTACGSSARVLLPHTV